MSVRDSNPANRRRSERVILQVTVVMRVMALDGKTLEEETHTSVVKPHDGLVKLNMKIEKLLK